MFRSGVFRDCQAVRKFHLGGKRMNLAQRLIKEKVLTPEQLRLARKSQKTKRGSLSRHLVDLKLVAPEVLAQFTPEFPPVPRSLQETGIPETVLIQLTLKHCLYRESFTIRELADGLKLPDPLVEHLIEMINQQKLLDIKPRDLHARRSTHMLLELRYGLSDLGRRRAEQAMEFNSYLGPAPVPLEEYWEWVETQSIQNSEVTEERLREVLSSLVVPDDLLYRLGPALMSGRSLFLFGPTGSGKTIIARAIGEAFPDPVFIPYAIYVFGQIISLFDEVNHQPVPTGHDPILQDRRWVLCQRPLIIAGGEMNEESLELKYNPNLRYYEAPHQLRANNGIFVIDDFGRQKVSPRVLLNRWMYPLETRQDFLCLNTGQQFAVPFDQLIVFATNLDPYGLADAAFLRRIRHKIFIGHVNVEQYLEIFRRTCQQQGIEFDEEAVRSMMARHYFAASRPMSACHPRDILENLMDRARFLQIKPSLSPQLLDHACQSYFVKPKEVIDYDTVLGDEPRALT
uniref:ATPase n=1 Tax=Desulfobacca acetoxidans TaxID=60893 RepID=A0A7V6A1I1_9BACT